jgi:hypothetical protein
MPLDQQKPIMAGLLVEKNQTPHPGAASVSVLVSVGSWQRVRLAGQQKLTKTHEHRQFSLYCVLVRRTAKQPRSCCITWFHPNRINNLRRLCNTR